MLRYDTPILSHCLSFTPRFDKLLRLGGTEPTDHANRHSPVPTSQRRRESSSPDQWSPRISSLIGKLTLHMTNRQKAEGSTDVEY